MQHNDALLIIAVVQKARYEWRKTQININKHIHTATSHSYIHTTHVNEMEKNTKEANGTKIARRGGGWKQLELFLLCVFFLNF